MFKVYSTISVGVLITPQIKDMALSPHPVDLIPVYTSFTFAFN